MYPTLTNFTQRKKKTHDVNGILALSPVSTIVDIYSFGKKFDCTYLKVTEGEIVLSYAKPFNEKMREQLVKIRKKKKKQVSNFSTHSADDMKTKKKHKSVLLV